MTFEDTIRQIVREEIRAAIGESSGRGTSSGDDLITIEEAAVIARRTAATIRGWQDSGKLKRHGQGRHRLVSRAQLRQVLEGKTDEQVDEEAVALRILEGGRRGKRL